MSEQEIVTEPAPTTLPPGMPDFGKVSQEYWQESQAKGALNAEKARKEAGIAVVTPPSTDPVLDAFTAAFETPVIMPVEWPDTVPEQHPIRQMPVHVRLWNAEQWARFWQLNKEDTDPEVSKENLHTQFWYVILVSACDNFGRPLFGPNNSSIPADEDQACKWLRSKFDGPAGLLTMNPTYVAALGFNGLLKGNEERDAKNSDTTSTSTSSGE